MRPGQKNRSRGRNGGGMPHHNRGGGGGGPRPPHRSQSFESNGPSVKIRGNAYQVFERYIAMAREAQTSGDRVAAENLYQHAEHYFRIMNAQGEGQQHGQPRPTTPADLDMNAGDGQGDGQGDGRGDGQGDGRQRDGDEGRVPPVQVQVHTPQPPPSDEQPPYRDEQRSYRDRDEQPPYNPPPYEPPRSY